MTTTVETSVEFGAELLRRQRAAPRNPLLNVKHSQKTPSAHSPSSDSSLQQRFVQLACASLKARHAAYGMTTPAGDIIQTVAADADASSVPLPWNSLLENAELLRIATNTDVVRHDNLAAAFPQLPFKWMGPFLSLRIANKGQCTGVLYFTRLPGAPAFTAEDAALAEAFKDFLEHPEIGEKSYVVDRLRLISQISQAASLNVELSTVLATALRELTRHLPMCICSVWMYSPDDQEVILTCASDPPSAEWSTGWLRAGMAIPLQDSPFHLCLNEKRPLYLDQLKDSPFPSLHNWGERGAGACLNIPLFSGQQAIGMLQGLCLRPTGLTRGHIHLLHMVADLLGPIIANFQFFEQMNSAYRQLQAAQQQLIHSEKMRAIGELAGGMAHDFNNALCSTLGFIELALLDQKLAAGTRRQLETAKKSAADAANTVRRVQDFARWDKGIQAGEVLDPNALMRDVAEMTRPKWNDLSHALAHPIELEVVTEAAAGILANPSEMREVLTNLIFNAVDAMPHGGKIILRTFQTEKEVHFQVGDTGTGIPHEVQQRIFEPFYTTKKERGNGLGLSVSYGIVKRHGGKFHLQSELGKGTTFTVSLPIAAASASQTHEPVLAKPVGLQILALDDEPDILLLLRQFLTSLGHYPQAAANGREALDLLRKHSFDLVITDLTMPEMNGEEVARAVHRFSPQTAVILLTGWADELLATNEPLTGIDLVLSKPITLDQLDTAIAKACHLHAKAG